MSKRRRKPLPAEPVEAQIESLSHDGRGIAHINGKVTFIFNALPGEHILFKYTSVRGSHDEGQTVEVLAASPERQTPPCKHFGLCGGCALQHLNTEAQLKHKQATFEELLQHQAGLTPTSWLPPLTSGSLGYRHKARLGAKHVFKKEKVLVGFRERDGRYVADLTRCEVLHPSVGPLLSNFSQLIESLSISDKIPQLEICIGDDAHGVIVRHLAPLTEEDTQKLSAFSSQHQLRFYLQPKGPDSITLLNDDDFSLHYKLPAYGLTLEFQPHQFTQVNFKLNQLMLAQALILLDPHANDHVLDLFCGIGNFSLPIAQHVGQVVGVEGDDTAVAQATKNAQANQLTNTAFYTANLFEPFANFDWAKVSYNKLLLDPPRAGAEFICEQIDCINPERIVYISCKPTTFARDAKILADKGYQLSQAGIMNMFPHTEHFECIGCFERI